MAESNARAESVTATVRAQDPWGLAVRIVAVAVAAGVSLWLTVALLQIVLQVVVAVILASGLSPLVGRLQRAGMPRALSVLLIYLGLIALLVTLGVVVLPPVVDEIEAAVAQAPYYGDQLSQRLRELREPFPFLPPLDEQLQTQLRGLGDQLGLLASQALNVARFVVNVFSGLLSILLVLLLTLYLVVDGPRIRDYFLSFVDPNRRGYLRDVMGRMGLRMGGWLVGQLTLCLVVGLCSFVGLTLLGVKGAVVLALIAGIGEAIPIVGPIASMIPAVIVAFTQSPFTALLTVGLYLLIQQLENNILVPKIMERAVNMHPLAVILSLLVGGELLGAIGAVIAVPVAAALAVGLDEARLAVARRHGDQETAREALEIVEPKHATSTSPATMEPLEGKAQA